jgi:fructose-bisphosphate aldolase/6-deoxy-5-ketofructose 1-phosphate synthase
MYMFFGFLFFKPMKSKQLKVPVSIPQENRAAYIENFELATQGTENLMLFAGDQKVEHLNDDFYGNGISPEDNDPEHMFLIAGKSKIGVFASQFGLISKYGSDYPKIPYIVKLNSKTHLVKTSQKDPLSGSWYDIQAVLDLKKTSGLQILGIGFTVYLGSEYESVMLEQAASLIRQAQWNGLLTVLWMYPRGKGVADEKDPHLIAGAAGVGACLGADFVKVNSPKKEGISSAQALKEAVTAAGRTKLICAGGSSADPEKFLQGLHDQINIGGASGNATGRNIHQKPLKEAIRFCNAISAITLEGKSVQEAVKIYNG